MAQVTMLVTFPTNVLDTDDTDSLNDAPSNSTNLQSVSVNKTPPASAIQGNIIGRYNSVGKSAVLKMIQSDWSIMCVDLAACQQLLTLTYDDSGQASKPYPVTGYNFGPAPGPLQAADLVHRIEQRVASGVSAELAEDIRAIKSDVLQIKNRLGDLKK